MMSKKAACLFLSLLPILLAGCNPGGQGGLRESWRVGQILTQGEQVESFTEVRTVQHCGVILEQKTVSCTAGTMNELAISTSGGTGVSLGLEVTLEAGVSNALGINRESGESLELVPPPVGHIYDYIVTTQYRIVSGEALATNSSGGQERMIYNFQAGCTLTIESVNDTACTLFETQDTPEPGEPTTVAQATQSQEAAAEKLIEEANTLFQDSNFEDAVARYDQAIEIDNRNPIAYNQRGNAHRKMMRFDLAIEDYTRAFDLADDDDEKAIYLNNRAAAKGDDGMLDSALFDIGQAIELSPEFAAAYETQARLYAANNDDVNAVLSYGIFLRLSPRNDNAFIQRGLAFARLGNYEAAETDFSSAISLKRNNESAWLQRGIVRIELGDYEGAIADFDQALSSNRHYGLAYYHRARAYIESGDPDSGIGDLGMAIESGYANPDSYLLRGNTYYSQEKYQQAADDFTKVIELDPESEDGYLGRGLALFSLEDLDNAILDYTRAIELNPNRSVAYYYRGAARAERGEYRNALTDLNIFLDLDPNSPLRPQVESLMEAINDRLDQE